MSVIPFAMIAMSECVIFLDGGFIHQFSCGKGLVSHDDSDFMNGKNKKLS